VAECAAVDLRKSRFHILLASLELFYCGGIVGEQKRHFTVQDNFYSLSANGQCVYVFVLSILLCINSSRERNVVVFELK
jgi:hypothetical protein